MATAEQCGCASLLFLDAQSGLLRKASCVIEGWQLRSVHEGVGHVVVGETTCTMIGSEYEPITQANKVTPVNCESDTCHEPSYFMSHNCRRLSLLHTHALQTETTESRAKLRRTCQPSSLNAASAAEASGSLSSSGTGGDSRDSISPTCPTCAAAALLLPTLDCQHPRTASLFAHFPFTARKTNTPLKKGP